MNIIMFFIVIAMLLGFMAADAILDYIFVIVYAALAAWEANSVLHLVRYRKKYGETNTEDVGFIVLYSLLAAGAAALQFTVL